MHAPYWLLQEKSRDRNVIVVAAFISHRRYCVMDPKRWSRPLSFQIHRTGEFRTISNTSEAATILNNAWPVARGRNLKSAKRTCRQVLSGQRPPSEARNAFIAAAVEADIFVKEK
ncbi:DUF982 domain-containing protein [Rhizobium sp. S152]|uniref:DUF982 domain-containing protein n=1 Tax=Rhizobium sp. S152 TaxID=3055038 RepID=UPI003FA735D0